MKITDIRIDGFGVWNTMSADGLSEEVTLFYGPNEAGKTTLMQFVRAVLYGFSEERRKLYLPPVFGGPPGGMLRVQNHGGEYTIERGLEEDDKTVVGRAIVVGENGSRQGQHLLNVLLSGIDESIFQNVFAVGIRELQELATLNDTQASEQLYNLASGVDRVSLVEVMRHLESERTRIWADEGEESELAELLQRRQQLGSEIDLLEQQTRRWADLAHQQRSLVTEIGELEQRIAQFEFDARTVEISIQVRDKWQKRADLNRKLERIGHVDPLPEGCVERLDEMNATIDQKREDLKPLKTRRLELRRELAAQPINKALWEQSCRIEAMCEHGPWLGSLDREIAKLSEDVEHSETELLHVDEELAVKGGVTLTEGVVVSSRMFQQLLAPAHALRDAIKKREIARTHHKKSRQEEEHALGDLEHELHGGAAETFEESLDRTATDVQLLRRRIQVEERIDAMQDQGEELERDNHELLDSQFQRVRFLAWIGVMFVFGSVLMLTGVFGGYIMPITWEVRWGIGLLGVLCTAMSMTWKTVAERTAEEELGDCFRRRETLEREIEQASEDRDELDRQLPKGAGTLATKLAAAEKQLRELEEKMPLQQDRQQAGRRTHESKRYAAGAAEEMREAKARWRRGLRAAGLPESLSPKHVRDLSAHHEKRSKIEEQLTEQRDRLEKLEGDRTILVERLQRLNADVGIETVSDDPQVQLSQLATALSGQREMVERRRELQKLEKEVRRELESRLKGVRRLQRAREALFAEARVTDEEALRDRADQLTLIAELTDRRDSLHEQIMAIIGSHCSQDDINQELEANSEEQLDSRWKQLLAKLHDSQGLLGQLHQQHGEVKQEMKSLAEDTRLAAAKFEMGCLEEKIAASAKEWQVLAVTLRMLEDIRESYEAERQPETLGEASLYLQKLTDGKYTRVWTPLGKNELRVDDAAGNPVPLDVLSRGTREAIFFSLRLALVAAYGRRGVNIPMILDDVLVNLDAKRAEAAVELLREFAEEGRQLLFFTCHEHIKDLFIASESDIRVLPAHGQPGTVVPRLEITEEEDVLLEFQPPAEEEEIPAEVWDLKEEEPEEEAEKVVEELEEEEVDEVFSELEDDSAFDHGSWWWEPTHRWSTEEEETAA